MQNVVIMNLAIWNGSWIVGHYFQFFTFNFWQIFLFPQNFHYSFFIVNLGIEVFQPDWSKMYLVFREKVLLAYIKSFCHNGKNRMYWVIWTYFSHCYYNGRIVWFPEAAIASMFTEPLLINRLTDFNKYGIDTILGATRMHTYIQFHIPGLWEAFKDEKILKIVNLSKMGEFLKVWSHFVNVTASYIPEVETLQFLTMKIII